MNWLLTFYSRIDRNTLKMIDIAKADEQLKNQFIKTLQKYVVMLPLKEENSNSNRKR